jgi:hypothetical protein
VRLIAERESLLERRLSQLPWEVERLSRLEVVQLLGDSDAMICF